MPRRRQYPTNADRQRVHRDRQRLQTLAPGALQRQIDPCTLYCAPAELLAPLLPPAGAIVTDPPYRVGLQGFDYTKPRRRPAQWTQNFAGADQDFDPTPWLRFPEVVLMGADHYWDRLPCGERAWSLLYWDKLAGTTPADFAPGEWIWLATATPPPPGVITHLWRGGMRAGEENISRLPQKLHASQKPMAVMRQLIRLTTACVILDPYMGSGTTLVAALREGRSCIGIDLDPDSFAVACSRVQAELQQLGLFRRGQEAALLSREEDESLLRGRDVLAAAVDLLTPALPDDLQP